MKHSQNYQYSYIQGVCFYWSPLKMTSTSTSTRPLGNSDTLYILLRIFESIQHTTFFSGRLLVGDIAVSLPWLGPIHTSKRWQLSRKVPSKFEEGKVETRSRQERRLSTWSRQARTHGHKVSPGRCLAWTIFLPNWHECQSVLIW